MAIFKFINRKYNTYQDLYNLVNYVMSSATKIYSLNMLHGTADVMCAQFQYYKKYYYKTHGNQALHFCLSIDSTKWENHVSKQDFFNCACNISLIFKDFQSLIALHTDKPSHWDIHFVCNTVSFSNGSRFHISQDDFNYIMNEVAMSLSRYHLALQSINYYDENGILRRGNEIGPFLYQNKPSI